MEKFVIEQVKIEGFKGFTEPKHIDLKGKHLFIFGECGNGKTSILEAIRWCLCGGRRGEEEALRNHFYGGVCQVELSLRKISGGSIYKVRRHLLPGGGSSERVAIGPDGKEQAFSKIFPRLPQLFSEEGIYIVLAEQSPWRPPTEISEFGQVIYSYLGWDELRDLLDKLAGVANEYERVDEELSREIEKLEEQGRERLRSIQEDLRILLSNPPWEGNPPTYADTIQKIRDFMNQLIQQSRSSPIEFVSSEMMLRRAETLIEEIRGKGRGPLEEQIKKLSQDTDKAVRLRVQWERVKEELIALNSEINEVTEELNKLTEGKSLQELEEELHPLEKEVKEKALQADLLQKALEALSPERNICPVCLREFSNNLEAHFRCSLQEISDLQKGLIDQRDKARERIEKARSLSQKKNQLESLASKGRREVTFFEDELKNLLGLENVTLEAIEAAHQKKLQERSLLQKQAEDLNKWAGSEREKIEKFRRELRFHELRKKEERLQIWLNEGLQKTQEAYQSFKDILDSADEIIDKINRTLAEELDEILPPLSKQMSQVYQRLTKQKSFDQIRLIREEEESRRTKAPEIGIKVYSSSFPERLFDPMTLNGQALRALYLTPYFVFSEVKGEVSELDFLMLDDPAQRFDNIRLQVLLEELKKVASHAQLIIATHEQERFEAFIPSVFNLDEYNAVVVKEFDPIGGPSFE